MAGDLTVMMLQNRIESLSATLTEQKTALYNHRETANRSIEELRRENQELKNRIVKLETHREELKESDKRFLDQTFPKTEKDIAELQRTSWKRDGAFAVITLILSLIGAALIKKFL